VDIVFLLELGAMELQETSPAEGLDADMRR